MKKIIFTILCILLLFASLITISYFTNDEPKKYKKSKEINYMDGITVGYQATVKIKKDKTIYFDPYKIDNALDDADYIFITHSHYDHYSIEDIKQIMNDNTKFIITADVKDSLLNAGVLESKITIVLPNNNYKVDNIAVKTIPAYNLVKTYHPKYNNWVGYVIELDGVKYYVAGDTDATEEMSKVVADVVFIPVGGTYTMNYQEAANIINKIKPKYAIPYHYKEIGSKSDAINFIKLLDEGIKGEM